MRIIAGVWRGRPLVAPPGATTRPTSDRVREALFSMLASRLGSFEGLRIADLYAGTGALGLEALSRGAAHCTFVEQDRAALDALRANIVTLGAGERAGVRPQSVSTLGEGHVCGLIFLDPPYHVGGTGALLDRLATHGWAAPGAWASVETAADEPVESATWQVVVERSYGAARLTLLAH